MGLKFDTESHNNADLRDEVECDGKAPNPGYFELVVITIRIRCDMKSSTNLVSGVIFCDVNNYDGDKMLTM